MDMLWGFILVGLDAVDGVGLYLYNLEPGIKVPIAMVLAVAVICYVWPAPKNSPAPKQGRGDGTKQADNLVDYCRRMRTNRHIGWEPCPKDDGSWAKDARPQSRD
jgi:hypothetical protein